MIIISSGKPLLSTGKTQGRAIAAVCIYSMLVVDGLLHSHSLDTQPEAEHPPVQVHTLCVAKAFHCVNGQTQR